MSASLLQKIRQRWRLGSSTRTLAQRRGDAAEDAALSYLQAQGLTCVVRNYRCRGGEIDLIMRERKTLVFVEVRYRHHTRRAASFGSAAESITPAKQRRLHLAAAHYLQALPTLPSCRFDVVTFDATEIDWLKDALDFTA